MLSLLARVMSISAGLCKGSLKKYAEPQIKERLRYLQVQCLPLSVSRSSDHMVRIRKLSRRARQYQMAYHGSIDTQEQASRAQQTKNKHIMIALPTVQGHDWCSWFVSWRLTIVRLTLMTRSSWEHHAFDEVSCAIVYPASDVSGKQHIVSCVLDY